MLLLVAVLLVQYGVYGGPPMYPRDPRDYPRRGQELWEPPHRYQTDPRACIEYGMCRDPYRYRQQIPPMPPFRPRYWQED